MYGIVVTMYDDSIVKAMEAVKDFVKTTYDGNNVSVYWVANIINNMPCIEEVRELETEYKYIIELHELPIYEGMMSGHNMATIIDDIKKKTNDKELKFIIGNHYEESVDAVQTGIKYLR